MPPLLTSMAVIMCAHGGRVQIVPKQTIVGVMGGGMILGDPDLVGAPISGCQMKDTKVTSPCRAVVKILPDAIMPTVFVAGKPVYVQFPGVIGITDGRPGGVIMCAFPGQVIVQAP